MSDDQQYQDPERLDLASASQLEIIVNCPGMVNLRRRISKEKIDAARSEQDKAWGKRGDRIHKAFQTDSILELDAEETDTYNQGKKFLDLLLEQWIEQNGLDRTKIEEGPRELRIWMTKPWKFPEPMFSAQLDRHYIYRSETRKMIFVADLKSGWNPNLPTSNRSWQLKSQLIAAVMEEYPDITEGRVAYIKAKDKAERYDYCDYNHQDLKYSLDSIVFHCWQSTQEDAPRRAGDHCRWCPCKADCPEAMAFSLLPSTMMRLSKQGRKRVAHADEVSLEDLAKLKEWKGAIEAILKAGYDRLKSTPDEELMKVGLMHGKPRMNSVITDLKAVCHFLTEEKAMFAPEQVWNSMSLSLTDLAAILALRKGTSEEDEMDYLKQVLAGFITLRPGEAPIVKLK